MFKYLKRFSRHRPILTVLLGAACVGSSFSLGMVTSGSVQPVTLIEAGSTQIRGDLNASGTLDVDDVRLLLETVQGYREANVADLIADFDQDGILTVDDALRALQIIASH
jgi:hypothetical protein